MKDDLNASEKRLIAALDRIDLLIDRATGAGAGSPPQPAPPEAAPELEAALAACEARLAETQDRLDAAGAEAGRLAEANAALVEANAALLAGAPGAAEIRQTFEAELAALRAARAAEMGQMGEILGTLDQWLDASEPEVASDARMEAPVDTPPEAAPPPEPARPAMVETPMPIDNASSETASGSTGTLPADRISTSEDRD